MENQSSYQKCKLFCNVVFILCDYLKVDYHIYNYFENVDHILILNVLSFYSVTLIFPLYIITLIFPVLFFLSFSLYLSPPLLIYIHYLPPSLIRKIVAGRTVGHSLDYIKNSSLSIPSLFPLFILSLSLSLSLSLRLSFFHRFPIHPPLSLSLSLSLSFTFPLPPIIIYLLSLYPHLWEEYQTQAGGQ